MHRVRRMWAVALVLGAAACGTDRAEETEPPVATCGDFAHHALVLLVRDGHDFRSFWCPAPADTGLMLPQFEQQPDGRVELLVYPRDGESHQATDYRGVYGFRGGRPELHVDDLCDWVEIATASCSLE